MLHRWSASLIRTTHRSFTIPSNIIGKLFTYIKTHNIAIIPVGHAGRNKKQGLTNYRPTPKFAYPRSLPKTHFTSNQKGEWGLISSNIQLRPGNMDINHSDKTGHWSLYNAHHGSWSSCHSTKQAVYQGQCHLPHHEAHLPLPYWLPVASVPPKVCYQLQNLTWQKFLSHRDEEQP